MHSNGWKHVFGGLKKKIDYAEQGSKHVSTCVDLKLKEIIIELFFADNEKHEQIQDVFIAKSNQGCM